MQYQAIDYGTSRRNFPHLFTITAVGHSTDRRKWLTIARSTVKNWTLLQQLKVTSHLWLECPHHSLCEGHSTSTNHSPDTHRSLPGLFITLHNDSRNQLCFLPEFQSVHSTTFQTNKNSNNMLITLLISMLWAVTRQNIFNSEIAN